MTRLSDSDSKQLFLTALDSVEKNGERVILQRNGQDIAVVAPIKDLARLETEPADQPAAESERPIWEQIIEIGKRIPQQELARIPTDLSKNLDHYLYGSPNREE